MTMNIVGTKQIEECVFCDFDQTTNYFNTLIRYALLFKYDFSKNYHYQ